MLNLGFSKGDSRSIQAVKNMTNPLIISVTEGAFGMILIPSVEQLMSNTNATGSEFKVPLPLPQRKATNGHGTRFPVNVVAIRNRNVVMGMPVIQEFGFSKNIVARQSTEPRLLLVKY